MSSQQIKKLLESFDGWEASDHEDYSPRKRTTPEYDAMQGDDEWDRVEQDEVDEATNHMGDREFQTWGAWRKACRAAGADRIDPKDEDGISYAWQGGRQIGNWGMDSEGGVLYADQQHSEMMGRAFEDVGEDDEYRDSYEDEKSELCSGCYVVDNQDGSGEVFRMSGDPFDRRVRIADKHGSGWNISPSRLTRVRNAQQISRWFGNDDIDEDATDPQNMDEAKPNRELYDRIRQKNVVPSIDRERYTDMSGEGLEGPFRQKNGQVLYYDPREGKYYNRDTDMYVDQADYDAMNESKAPKGSMKMLIESMDKLSAPKGENKFLGRVHLRDDEMEEAADTFNPEDDYVPQLRGANRAATAGRGQMPPPAAPNDDGDLDFTGNNPFAAKSNQQMPPQIAKLPPAAQQMYMKRMAAKGTQLNSSVENDDEIVESIRKAFEDYVSAKSTPTDDPYAKMNQTPGADKKKPKSAKVKDPKMLEGDPDIPMDAHIAGKSSERKKFRDEVTRDPSKLRKMKELMQKLAAAQKGLKGLKSAGALKEAPIDQTVAPANQQQQGQAKPAAVPLTQPKTTAQQAPAPAGQPTAAATPGNQQPPAAGQAGGAPVAAPAGTPGAPGQPAPAAGNNNAATTPLQTLSQTVNQLAQNPAAAKQAALKLNNVS